MLNGVARIGMIPVVVDESIQANVSGAGAANGAERLRKSSERSRAGA